MPSNVVGFSCVLGFIKVLSVSLLIFLCNPYKSRLNPVTLDIALCIHSNPTVIRDPEDEKIFVFSCMQVVLIEQNQGLQDKKKDTTLIIQVFCCMQDRKTYSYNGYIDFVFRLTDGQNCLKMLCKPYLVKATEEKPCLAKGVLL